MREGEGGTEGQGKEAGEGERKKGILEKEPATVSSPPGTDNKVKVVVVWASALEQDWVINHGLL